MRNKKLFTLISIILILSLVFIGCGKKSHVEEKDIENEKIVDVEKKDISEPKTKDIDDDEDVEVTVDNADAMDSEKENNSTSSSNISKENKKTEAQKKSLASNTKKEPNPSNTEKDNKSTVTITIIGPDDVGIILETTEVEIIEGDTVFDVLKQVVKDKSIQMEYKGRKSNVYIQGIHNIYEFDNGPESGWLFRVNGEVSQTSSGAYKLNDGDRIEWLYTTDLGREFGAKTTGGGK